jgi:hypothetical protein
MARWYGLEFPDEPEGREIVPWPPSRIELRGAAPFSLERFALEDEGGVKACQPGRSLFTEPREVWVFVRFSGVEPPRLKPDADPPRAESRAPAPWFAPAILEFEPFEGEFPRDALKKCCELDGALRTVDGFAARPLGL